MDLEKKLIELSNSPSELSIIGEIVTDLSHEILQIEDNYDFFRALLFKLIGENLLQNFVEDGALSAQSVPELNKSILLYVELLQFLEKSNGFREYARKFGKLYKNLINNKQLPNIEKYNEIEYYQGTDDRPIFMKSTNEKNLKFFDTDLIFSNILNSDLLISDFLKLIKKAISRYSVNRLCFVEKRKGPLGTILILSNIVRETKTPAFIFRARFIDDISRIKGHPPNSETNVGIVYDATNTGGGLEEVINYLKDSYNCKISFAAVITDHAKGAEKKLWEKHKVNLISLFSINEIEKYYNQRRKEDPKKLFPENKLTGKKEREEEAFIKLKNFEQKNSLLNTLLDQKIPYSSYSENVYSLSEGNLRKLSELGILYETIKPINLGDLPLEERNDIKRKCRSFMSSQREDIKNKLRNKYGVSN